MIPSRFEIFRGENAGPIALYFQNWLLDYENNRNFVEFTICRLCDKRGGHEI